MYASVGMGVTRRRKRPQSRRQRGGGGENKKGNKPTGGAGGATNAAEPRPTLLNTLATLHPGGAFEAGSPRPHQISPLLSSLNAASLAALRSASKETKRYANVAVVPHGMVALLGRDELLRFGESFLAPRTKKLTVDGLQQESRGDAAALRRVLSRCRELEELHINQLGQTGCRALAATFEHTSALRVLDLRHEPLLEHGAIEIAAGLRAHPLRNLTHLLLSRTELEPRGFRSLADALVHDGAPALQVLNLHNNPHVSEDGGIGALLAAVFPHVPHLTEVHVGRMGLRDADVAAFAPVLPALPMLHVLSLRDNDLGNAGAATLTGILPRCPGLLLLDIENNMDIEGEPRHPVTPLGALVAAAARLPDCRVLFGNDWGR